MNSEQIDNFPARSAWRNPKSDPVPAGFSSPLGVAFGAKESPAWVPTFTPPAGRPADGLFGVPSKEAQSFLPEGDEAIHVTDTVVEISPFRAQDERSSNSDASKSKKNGRGRFLKPVATGLLFSAALMASPHAWNTHPPEVPPAPVSSINNNAVEQPLSNNLEDPNPKSPVPQAPTSSFTMPSFFNR